ncbi:high-affinity zinc uptake system binding-protein ZnuA [Spirochaetia bacterium]|nr:high-affinity zinc uptake system binding-protein ZnuA [Spirochaetia bacterium]
MKRVFLLTISVIATLFFVSGCTQKKNNRVQSGNGKITITATIFPQYDFVRAVAGGSRQPFADKVNLSMLLPPASESHSFEPTPKDIITIQKSDIFIYVGGESDEWVNRILESMDTRNMTIIALMDTVDVVEEEIVEGMEEEAVAEDSANTEEEAAYDEHVWTSPQNAVRIVRSIADALCSADNANADFYRQNADDYIAQLDELDAEFQAVVNNAKRKTIVFGDRFPFRYFADRYGLSYFAAFPGCSTETEPSAGTVAFLIDKIKAEKIPVVFYIELGNERMAGTIAEETGAEKLLLHACHNISKKDFENGATYIDLMRQNVENLRRALQ